MKKKVILLDQAQIGTILKYGGFLALEAILSRSEDEFQTGSLTRHVVETGLKNRGITLTWKFAPAVGWPEIDQVGKVRSMGQ